MRSIFPFFSYLIIGVFLIGASCERVASTQNSDVKGSDFVVAFYNVENLFDTSDDPKKNDEDFTPTGKLAWTEDRYQVKLGRIAQVIDSTLNPNDQYYYADGKDRWQDRGTD